MNFERLTWEYVEGFLLGLLLASIPTAYLVGKLKTIDEKEQFRLVASECSLVTKAQRNELNALMYNQSGDEVTGKKK